MNPDQGLAKCIRETVLQNNPRFEWDDMELFNALAQCEVLVLPVGCTDLQTSTSATARYSHQRL